MSERVRLYPANNKADGALKVLAERLTAQTILATTAFSALTGSAKQTEKVFTDWNREMTSYSRLYGSYKDRKPYLKQPGVQFAVFSDGRLRHFKRLRDGSVVKV